MGQKIKNQLLREITIGSASNNGKCVARWNERVIFVEGVAPGDIADIRIIRKKKNYLEAIPEQIIRPSNSRSTPFCSHFGTCGGCKWQHISYQYQLDFKRQQVIDSFKRLGNLNFPEVNQTLASPDTQYYRNKLEFTFSNWRWLNKAEIESGATLDRNGLGFHKPGQFDKVVNVDHCYLQRDPSNEIRNRILEYAKSKHLDFYDIRNKKGFLRNLIIRTTSSGQLMVILQVGEERTELPELLAYLDQEFPEITSLQYVINSKGNETFFDLPVQLFSGSHYITEAMGNLEFRIGPKSFYQTNSSQAYRLYKLVKEVAGLTGNELVYDLYAGTGTIGLFLASGAREVIGIEQVPEAVADAKINAEANGIDNVRFYAGDTREIINEVIETHGQPEIVITDPPRAGMHQDVVEKLIEVSPKRIVYVSCNPATQARDLALFDTHYEIKSVYPVDMFPHTHHVECVAVLEHRENGNTKSR